VSRYICSVHRYGGCSSSCQKIQLWTRRSYSCSLPAIGSFSNRNCTGIFQVRGLKSMCRVPHVRGEWVSEDDGFPTSNSLASFSCLPRLRRRCRPINSYCTLIDGGLTAHQFLRANHRGCCCSSSSRRVTRNAATWKAPDNACFSPVCPSPSYHVRFLPQAHC
jgi:hypothetical protein